MIFPNASRSELSPYSSASISGLKARYELSDHYISSAFYANSTAGFYVLTITHPQKFEEELQPLVDEILNTFKIL
jgi:hypothetical protein